MAPIDVQPLCEATPAPLAACLGDTGPGSTPVAAAAAASGTKYMIRSVNDETCLDAVATAGACAYTAGDDSHGRLSH